MYNEPSNSQEVKEDNPIPYKHCLNCGTELNGMYCHSCGQHASTPTPKVSGFIMEYLNNAFFWDPNLLSTLWKLLCKPGYITRQYISGKFVSYVHPLKLNMFILFVFITLFLLFSNEEKVKDSVHNLATNEMILPGLSISMLTDNEEYAEKIELSTNDTVSLLAPLYISTEYPKYIKCLEVIEDTEGESLDRWTAVLPSILITDEIIIQNTDSIYHFNTECKILEEISELQLISDVWKEMINLTTQYIPIIVLLTAPLLAFAILLAYRKKHRPFIHHFIFALYYTAFLELLITLIYILYLFHTPLNNYLDWIVIISSCLYLTIDLRQVYGSESWFKAIIKSLMISLTYFLIVFITFMIIFITASFIILSQTV